jgi:large subunit ribosomal protein L20
MARVKRGVTSHAKHKKVLKAAKGFYGRRKNTIRVAKQSVEKANQYAYRDRKRENAHSVLCGFSVSTQRCAVWTHLQSLHRRHRQGRNSSRSETAIGSCNQAAAFQAIVEGKSGGRGVTIAESCERKNCVRTTSAGLPARARSGHSWMTVLVGRV